MGPIFYLFFLNLFFVYIQPLLMEINSMVVFSVCNSILTEFAFLMLLFPNGLIMYLFSGRETILWFGHFLFSIFTWKLFFFIFAMFNVLSVALCLQFQFISREINDCNLVLLNFFYWIFFLFTANTLISIFFVIEILSTLLMLILITTGDIFFSHPLQLTGLRNTWTKTTPPFSAIFIFFWISLVTSLFLFLTLLNCWKSFNSLDLFFFELVCACSFSTLLYLFPFIFFLFFSFFLKCGVVPFFFWKPIFFRNLPLICLWIYVFFFFFFLLIFFFYLFINFFTIFLQPFAFFFLFLLMSGFFALLFSLCESFYLKTFIALSSILNTFLLFFPLINNFLFFFF